MIEPNNVELQNALRRLRDSAAGERVSPSLEGRLVTAFRAQHRRKTPTVTKWVSIAVAASLVVAIAWRFNATPSVEAPRKPVAAVAAPPAVVPGIAEQAPEKDAVRPVPSLRAKTTRPRVPQRPAIAPTPVEFIEIPYAPSIGAFDEAQVVRVNMPGASARRLGLAVGMDRIQADVLLGNDGIARAIRLVSTSGLNSER